MSRLKGSRAVRMMLPLLQSYSTIRVAALIALPSLTSLTLVDLARQIQRSNGFPKCLWLVGGALAAALGVTCVMELSTGAVEGSYAMAFPDHLLQGACACAGCAWTLAAWGQRRLKAGWVLGGSAVLAVGFTAIADKTSLFRLHQNITAAEISVVSLLVTGTAAYLFLKIGALAKAENSSFSARTFAASAGMGVLMAGSLVFAFQTAKAVSLTVAQDYLADGLPLMALCLGTTSVLLMVLTATTISRLNLQRSAQLQQTLDEQKMRDTLSDQRVTRLQNEALLQEIQERRTAESRLRHAAFHDAATGLGNRASIDLKLTDLLAERRMQRRPAQAAVILLHLDDLNSVRSLVGRDITDLVLQEVARRLKRFATGNHILARVGDDEFLLLMMHLPAQEQALRKANLMLSSVEDTIVLHETVVTLSASVGVCEVNTGHVRADDVLRDADLAAEVAKRDGGKQSRVFHVSMRDEALELQQRKRELKSALEREEFVLFYQPFVDMRDRSIYGMEALIRWNHPTRGFVSPGTFIPLAEESGQILNIGEWTLRSACRQFNALQAESKKDLLLSVNVSPRQLFETPFLKLLREVLDETAMPPAKLQLEVTESIFLKDAASVGTLMQEIRSLEVKIAFDDFGTGYSSLSYLTRYPIDTLKVDQSFVRSMTQSQGAANLVLFMMGLAKEFKMSVTAEGVEEVAQEAALLKQGCCFAQGYLYSRPVPLDVMAQLLRRGLTFEKTASSVEKGRLSDRAIRTIATSSHPAANTH